MNVALSRKRSRLTIDDDDDEVPYRREPSPALPVLGENLKRSKTQCELEELDIISPEEAWSVDLDAILASNTLATPPGSMLQAHDNWPRYKGQGSIIVLCVQGNVQVHYELLCSALPDLYALSPSLQALVLCHDPSTHRLSSSAPFSLPIIQAATPSNNHFVRLGLLHPLGGGKFPLDALEQPTGLFIDNEFVDSSSPTNTISSIDPATEKEIAVVQAASEQDVDRAVQAAKKALKNPEWKQICVTQRGRLMAKLADLMEENKELLATIDAWDNGKPYSVALNEDLPEAFSTIRYYAGWADKISGQTISTTPQKFAYTLRQPIGVIAQIIPWNYPLSMACWKLGPALACGNTVVLKAAEQTPLSILILAKLIKQAGFPAGVVNILNGLGREAGAALVQHPLVDKVAFTGSTTTATQIMKMAAAGLRNITLETGGKSPLIVFEDADMEQAVRWSHVGIMSNQGQICTATSRILVQESIFDSFITQFRQRIKVVSVIGDQWSDDTFQGPQVTKQQYERVLSYVDIGKSEGAKLIEGGEACEGNGYYRGDFGPFVVIATFSSEEEAINMANDSIFGLGSAIFTKDLERAHRVAAEIESGMVWVNSSQDCDYRIPFGGVKQSGIGRELGEAGLEAYSQLKAVHINMGNKL
ncbi:uncharacterized protein ALTATR162_LOCUS10520 [Alternaria atra]|uniref:Aldehyde dehydrogenase domain-containing protein n=1 Tax=Alternaria atra TaxID=119953 RepID=A0A8J2IME4_9PLEO|nr:uncharacterized protein ALTATR162_LOCUS10520 [Alternaria atra]CAG5183315.1 unnamed protein product [Alternaria atra]